MNAQDSSAEVFDVFLCHNSEDKPAVRDVAQKLSQENVKPWLDEADIKAGSFGDAAIGHQIETVRAAAVFVGQHGVGPWQRREIIALLDLAPHVLGAILIGGLIGGLGSSPPGQITPVEMMAWRWNQFWKGFIPPGWQAARRFMIIMAFLFLFFALFVGLAEHDLIDGLLSGLKGWLFTCLTPCCSWG